MMKNLNQFWSEKKGEICAGCLAVMFTVGAMTLPYINYFLL
ncbi:MAG: hypothetical protein ACI4F3_11720 [Enterocloster sp.]